MGDLRDLLLQAATKSDTPSPEYNPNTSSDVGAQLLQHMNNTLQSAYEKGNPSYAPSIFAPNPQYNTTDYSMINKDQEALQSTLGNAWNDFKRGIDMTQISTDKGKMETNMIGGDGPSAVIDNSFKELDDLKKQHDNNLLNDNQYAFEVQKINQGVTDAQEQMTKLQKNVDENNQEVEDEPVSKEYLWKSSLIQGQGDQASLWSKLLYTAPNTIGSSSALMLPTLAATFGNKITQALIKSSISELAGPEIGIPVQAIATIGAIAGSVAELGYGRLQETYGEVSGAIDENRQNLVQKYMQDHSIDDPAKIPDEDMRNIRIQSRVGAKTQFWENMALSVTDVAGAMLMPLGNFGSGLSKLTKFTEGVEDTIESVKNYNKLSRLMTTAGEFTFENYKEKFEEGFQQAAQYRAQDTATNGKNYQDNGFLRNVLEDGYDTATSLNYSLIPGIDLRGNGRYSDDKTFQFSENSGGILATIMGGLPVALAVRNDFVAYKQANKDLQATGLQDINGKFKRLQNSIMIKYFDNDEVHHLGEAIKSLTNKKDEAGNPMLSKDDAVRLIKDMHETYEVYDAVNQRLANIGSGILGETLNTPVKSFNLDKPEVREAKLKVREDLINAITNIRDKRAEIESLETDANIQYSKDRMIFEENTPGSLSARMEIEAKKSALESLEQKWDKTNTSWNNAKEMFSLGAFDLEGKLRAIREQKEELEHQLDTQEQDTYDDGKLFGHWEASPQLKQIYEKVAASKVFLSESQDKLAKLNSIKTVDDLKGYANENISRPTPASPVQADDNSPTVEDIADKLKNNQALSPEEQQFRANNNEAVEDVLKQSAPQPAQTTATSTEPEQEPQYDETQQELKNIITPAARVTPAQKARSLNAYLNNLGVDVSDLTFPEFFDGMKQLFNTNPDYLRNNFQSIRELYNTLVPGSQAYELGDGLDVIPVAEIPPVQRDDIDLNDKLISSYKDKELTPKGSDDMIVSGLSLAQRNVTPKTNSDGSIGDMISKGELQFSFQHDQQLANTSIVNSGDSLELGIANMPTNFDKTDTSDTNYDKVEIGVYKDIEVKPGITKRMLLFHLHRIDSLDRLLSDTVNGEYPLDKEAEKALLRTNRRIVIEGGEDTTFKCEVLSKGFGYLNNNDKRSTTTIANAIGNDTRPVLSYVDGNGDPVSILGKKVVPAYDMIPGATILLLPNTTDNGLVYVPIYVAKRQLKEDPQGIHETVFKAIDEYLDKGTRKTLDKVAPYVYLTSVDSHKMTVGVKGIFASNKDGIVVYANNKQFTPQSREGLREAIGETYFTVNKDHVNDDAYQTEVMKSPVLQTSIKANPVLLDRFNNGPYSFLNKDGEQEQYSYFSQHTVTIGSIAQAEEATPITETKAEEADEFDNLLDAISFDDIDVTPVKEGKLAKIARKLGTDIKGFWDDISSGVKRTMLVSPEIPASLQHEMVRSIAFNLVSAERPDDDEVDMIKNVDRARAFFINRHNLFSDEVKKRAADPSFPAEKLRNANKLVENYRLLTSNFDALLDKSRELIESLGYRYDEDSDYYENLEEEGEDNDFVNFDDDANSTRNQQDFLPKEVKKIMYFTPAINLINLNDEADKRYVEQEIKKGNPVPTYRPALNELGLPSFNNFSDTWEKTLEITSTMFFDATDTGFEKMLNALSDKSNPPVVQELAKNLQKVPEQVQNAFFRRTKLQKQTNVSALYTVRDVKTGKAQGSKKFLNIFPSDRKQGIKTIIDEMQDEFLTSNTGMLVTKRDETTGSRVFTVNTEYAKQLRDQIESILAKYRPNPGERVRGENNISEVDKKQLYYLVRNIGIKFSEQAFNDLLKYHRTSMAGSSRDVSIIRELFSERILKRLAGEGKKSAKRESDESDEGIYDDLRGNNPFTDERSSIFALAKQEIKYRTQLQTGSYYFERKSYYAYVRSNYLSDFFTRMKEFKKTGVDTFIKAKLINDAFSKTSIYLKGLLDPRVDMGLDMFGELGSRNKASDNPSKLLKNMNPREHQVTKLSWFQNMGAWKAYFMWDTLSDKSFKPVVTAKRFDISNLSYINPDLIKMSTADLDRVYSAHFLNEVERINNTITQNTTLAPHELIKGYHDIGKKEGMGKVFNVFFFMNKAVLNDSNPKLSKDLYNDNGSIKTIDANLKDRILNELNNHINKVIQASKKDFQDLGLYNLDATTSRGIPSPDLTDLVDHNYMFTGDLSVSKKLGLDNVPGMNLAQQNGDWSMVPRDVLNRIVDYVTADYAYNYMLFSNEMLLLTGDPAQAGKAKGTNMLNDSKVLMANITATNTNLNKRNAAFLASGEGGKFRSNYYNVSIAEDIDTNSEHLAYYTSLFPNNKAGVEDAYGANEKMTDAQEVTTVKEFLDDMLAYGQLSLDKYTKALFLFDRDQYNEDLKKGLVKEVKPSIKEKETLEGLIMQPQKPVQRTYNVDNQLQMSKQYYIKTSAYPLIPSMVDGAMADLLKDMKANDIQRVAFVSGVKQGVAGSKQMFNKDGGYNTSFFENNRNSLHRNGFRIQLEVPFKESKDHIREGTQQSKLIMVDIHDDTPMSYRDSQVTAKELKDKYIDYHKQIVSIQKNAFMDEIGVTERNGVMTRDLTKLSSLLQREGEGRGYALTSLLGLDLRDGAFKVPLTFLPNAGQIEPVITSLVSNNVTRLKMPGKSYVQGSEFALKTGKGRVEADTNIKDRRDIVWTKLEYEGLEKLQYLHKDGQGTVKHAQIVMPFYFIKGKKMLDVHDFTKTVDGRTYLDTDKVDPSLLEMNGFRIPFQGLNSGMWFEIVGFLPKTVGDLVIVPAEIAGQMGSDYDVDKLYSYMYNYKFNESGTKFSEQLYQGREGSKDNRTYNYFTTNKEEASSYGEVHEELIQLENVLEKAHNTEQGLKWTREYEELHDAFRKKEGYGFDILDNSPEGLTKQNKFFAFLKAKGFDGLSLISEHGKLRGDDQQTEDRYVISFGRQNYIQKVDNPEPTTKEELQNALIDIQKSVYTSPVDEIHKAILEPQSFTDLEETVKTLGLDSGREFLGAFDPLFQRDLYFSNSTGKLGTAISANNNTSHAMSQTSNLYIKGTGFMFLDEEGNPFSDHIRDFEGDTNSVNKLDSELYEYFPDEESDVETDENGVANQNDNKGSAWRLDKIRTFEDPITKRTYNISNLLNQMLGVSVDNAKEQKLGALGVNRINFNIAESIIRAGFSPNYMSAFINQPILKEYYERIGETEDIYKIDFTPNKRQKAIDDLFDKYTKMYNIQQDVQNNTLQQGYKLSDMMNWLKSGITDKNAADQLYILKAFLRYKDISDKLQNLTSTFNIDAKGLPKNVSETITKADKISQLEDDSVIGNVANYRTNTIPGLFLGIPDLAVRIFAGGDNPLFAYASPAYSHVSSNVMEKTGRAELSQDRMDIVHNNIKQFVYSGFAFPDGGYKFNNKGEVIYDDQENISRQIQNLIRERQRLLFDTQGNDSLQTRLIALKEKHPKNDFLASIKEIGSIFPDNPKLVEMPLSNEEQYVQKTTEGWEAAIYGADPDISAFAKDLFKYALYVAPQEYGQVNITRYLPFRYQEEIGFPQYLNTVNKNLSDEDTLSLFADQFLAHRQEFLLSAREANFMPGTLLRNEGTIEAFTLPAIVRSELSKNPAASLVRQDDQGIFHYPEYLAVFNTKELGKQTYRRIDNTDGTSTYTRVEKKGMSGMSEYSMYQSGLGTVIDTQKVGLKIADTDSTLVVNAMGLEPFVLETPTDVVDTEEYMSDKHSASDMMKAMIAIDNNIIINPSSSTDNRRYARLYQFLAKEMQDRVDVSIQIDEDHPTAATTIASTRGTTVIFNPIRIASNIRTGLSQELEQQRTVLHEFLHAELFNALQTKKGTPEYQALVDVWNAYKDNIYKESKDKVRGIPVNALDAEIFSYIKENYDNRDRGELSSRDFLNHMSQLINDPNKLSTMLQTLGQRMAKLHDEGKIANANFDLVSNSDRAKDFKDYMVDRFMPNLKDITNKYYGYYDLHEFVSEALTNKETQNILRQMPSIWERLVSAIKKFLAAVFHTDPTERNLMDDAFDAVFNLLRDGEKSVSLGENRRDDIDTQLDQLIEAGLIKTKC